MSLKRGNFLSQTKLCPEINLIWDTKFTLLGIDFDNNLVTMEDNFWSKIRSIEKLLASWSYRYLTPYGKITIIKSLALSKLSHVALVIPSPSKRMLKYLETIIHNFLWNDKSEKVCRADTKLPEHLGGLNMPDIENFWTAFKFSWVRRLLVTKSFWPIILQQQINIQTGTVVNIPDLFKLGPVYLSQIGRNLKNSFWRETFKAISRLTDCYLYSFPERITNSSFWYNPLIRRNNKVLKPAEFPEIMNVVFSVGDLLYPNTNTIMTHDDFIDRYNLNISIDKFTDIRYILKLAWQKMRLPPGKIVNASYPDRPLIIEIANMITKGCGKYTKLLNIKTEINNKIEKREEKWHRELQVTYSNIFWEKTRKLCKNITDDNPLKWMQYQIVRNSLQTNYIISHFKRNMSPLCTFCDNSAETVSHIYWFCAKTAEFLNEAFDLVNSTDLQYRPTMQQFLFGFHHKYTSDPENFLSLHLKKYIWVSKFKTKVLSLVGFRYYFKNVLKELKVLYDIREKKGNFNVWEELQTAL